MDEIKITITDPGFPDDNVSDSDKNKKEFGLRIGQAIQYEWFKKDGGGCRYYDRWTEFNRRRLYARAEQPIQKYEDELSVDGDLSHLNLDWTPIAVMPKFIDIVCNGLEDRIFSIKAESQDSLSVKRKQEFQDVIESEMISKPLLEQVEKDFGINPFINDKETLPKTDEELYLYMELEYKPGIEIAEEIAIQTVLNENHYEDIAKRFKYDLVVLGMGALRHRFLRGGGIDVSYLDPARVIHSYTEDPMFKDCYYWGDVETVPVSELVKIDPDLTNEDLAELKSYSQAWMREFPTERDRQNSELSSETVTLINFSYKTTKKYVYKKKKISDDAARVIRKDDDFNPPQEMMEERGFEKVEKRIEVWYEGIMVAGTNFILKWELQENMVRPKSASQRVMSNYVACAPRLYKGAIDSIGLRMIPFADMLQLNHMKFQQVSSKMVPDGVFIDADGINEVDLGTGAAYNPEDALRLYFQTGSVIGRSYTQDGDFNNARTPIQELTKSSAGGKINSLIAQFNHYLNLMKGAIGANDSMDASTPHKDALVGLQKMAALSSNVATRHILEGSIFMTRTLAEGLSCRVSDLLEYSDYKEEFINKIGKQNVSILEDVKDLYLSDFGIFIEVSPDEEQKQKLEENIQIALREGGIDLEDAIDIREINNIKLANQLLKVKRKRKRDYDQQIREKEQQSIAQTQMQQQQMAAQNAAQKIQMEAQAKIQVKNAEGDNEIRVLEREAQLKFDLMQKEFDLNTRLKSMDMQVRQSLEDKKEKAKDRRQREQATMQSKMVSQRKFDLPSLNFESNEDSLDGFDLAEFDPR